MAALILPALLFVATAVAQDCSTSGTTTISVSAEASALASCTTYSGSVAIPTGLDVPRDSDGHQQLQVDTLRKITGNLTVTDNGQLTSLSFGSLQSVDGFELGALERLAQLSFPQLSTVDALNFTALPALQTLNFGNIGITKARSILITNTGLAALTGIDNLQDVDLFNVNNNPALTNISLQVKSIKGSLNILANDGSPAGLTTSFPLLETALNMTFRNCSQIFLPALKNVTDELGFYGNTFTNFTAPKLTTAGGITFVDNTELVNVSLPNLEKVDGAFQIANNTELDVLDGFKKLAVVAGTLDFRGEFSEVDLPALTQVQGAFTMVTTEEFNCDPFDKAQKNKIIKGEYKCHGKDPDPEKAGGSNPSSTTGSGSKPSGAASPLDLRLSLVMGSSSLVATILQLFL